MELFQYGVVDFFLSFCAWKSHLFKPFRVKFSLKNLFVGKFDLIIIVWKCNLILLLNSQQVLKNLIDLHFYI